MMREVSDARRWASAVSRDANTRTCSGSSAADSMASASRLTAPTGVFSSWLVFATKSRRICSTRSRSVMSRRTMRVRRGDTRVARTVTRRDSAGGAPRISRSVSAVTLAASRAFLATRRRSSLPSAAASTMPYGAAAEDAASTVDEASTIAAGSSMPCSTSRIPSGTAREEWA